MMTNRQIGKQNYGIFWHCVASQVFVTVLLFYIENNKMKKDQSEDSKKYVISSF